MMQIIQSQNAPLEAKQTKTSNPSVNTQNSTEVNAKTNTEVAKASEFLQPDMVNIGNNKASNALTYDIKTMSRETNTSYITGGAETGPKPAAHTSNGSSPEENVSITSSITGGAETGPKPAVHTGNGSSPEENVSITSSITGGAETGPKPA